MKKIIIAFTIITIATLGTPPANAVNSNHDYPCEILDRRPDLAYEGELESCDKNRTKQTQRLLWISGGLVALGVGWYIISQDGDEALSLISFVEDASKNGLEPSYDFDRDEFWLRFKIDY